ncbi:MAG: trypsin-like peptidase domain-containing protein [Planctomycetales bacterium]|nr:trypsin-like peptidase domain-containing protein [Planctomycetales bacterium]
MRRHPALATLSGDTLFFIEMTVIRFNPFLVLVLMIASVGPTVADEASHQSLIAKVRPSVTTIRVQGRDGDQLGIGTGFVIDDNGLIATNFHVINEGRRFTIESADGESLKVLTVEASDVTSDLALIRVDATSTKLPALALADEPSGQGLRVLAFGNPLGLRNSVVEGIVSARQEIEGRELLQLAMPIEPGNSGGPLVDLEGRVHGIINMKSAIDDNLGFAIPVQQLVELKENPNPVDFDRWVRIGRINEQRWMPLFGANWQERGGRITARGLGKGFGGRSLLLSKSKVPELPFEIAVMVRLDDESGAAGLVFHSDGAEKHYGFYPSDGRLRLSCFLGSSVYSWQVLHEVESDHYLEGQWNQLKVRVEKDSIRCFVNGELVIQSNDSQLTTGQVGLAKFRSTEPEFSGFQIGSAIVSPTLSESSRALLARLEVQPIDVESINAESIDELGQSWELSSRELTRRAMLLEKQAERIRQLAGDVRRAATIDKLARIDEVAEDERLLFGTLLIAKLDYPDLDVEAYQHRIDEMADEIKSTLPGDATPVRIRDAMHRYLFDENGFHGSRSEYYHAANSHLNRVIDDREGLPITMSVLYIELGRRLGIHIDGIGLPGHFVTNHVIDENDHQLVDVFERGKLLSQKDAETIVAMHARRLFRETDLQPSSDREILTRILNNLVGIAGRKNDGESMLKYCDAIVAINPDQTQFRMMRAQLRGMTGRIGLGLDDVDKLLENDPPDLDRGAAERLREALIERQ